MVPALGNRGGQNEYESVRWGVVRNIKCWDLLIVEKCLRSILKPEEVKHWLYQAARDYVGGSIYYEKGRDPTDRGDRPFLARVSQAQSERGIMCSGAIWTPFSDLDTGRVHARFQRFVTLFRDWNNEHQDRHTSTHHRHHVIPGGSLCFRSDAHQDCEA